MRKNLPITNNNNDYDAYKRIVSTTDEKGRITYVNQDFLDISGFSEEELMGKAHNIVRHPDMPPAAFDDMWKTIQQGKPWMGIVKNRCKNGDHYWVDAFVTPIFENEHITGYQSVRMKPDAGNVTAAEKLYSRIMSGSKPALWERLTPKLGLMGKMVCSSVVSLLLGVIVFTLLHAFLAIESAALLFAVSCVVMLLSGVMLASVVAKPWQQAATDAAELFKNDIAQRVYTGRHDELGQLQLLIHMQQSKLESVIWRISDATNQLKDSVEASMETVTQTRQNMEAQNQEIEQVATAMNEMTATVSEIAKNTSNTAGATQHADERVNCGKDTVATTIDHINALAGEVENAVEKINELAQDSKHIGGIVDVITEIAEQTNLLALNAAIEAARAGEQGRGFAVVADEVRTLASRTQSATQEIHQMISKLQSSAQTVVDVVQRGQDSATKGVEKANNAGDMLGEITQAVNTITQMTTQIATAAEEQSAVSEEINRNIISISNLSEDTVAGAKSINKASIEIDEEAIRLTNIVKQFGVTA